MSENACYRINPLSKLHWATWDDEFVVFDEASGQTHHMDAFRGFVLDVLIERKCNFDHLLQQSGKSMAVTDAAGLSDALNAVLVDFMKHGLVEVNAE